MSIFSILVFSVYPGLESGPQAAAMLLQQTQSIWLYLGVWFGTSFLLSWKLGNILMSSKCRRCPSWYFSFHSVLKYENNCMHRYCSLENLWQYLRLGLWKRSTLVSGLASSFSRMCETPVILKYSQLWPAKKLAASHKYTEALNGLLNTSSSSNEGNRNYRCTVSHG